MSINIRQIILLFGLVSIPIAALYSQSKVILDKQSTGGYCNNYFDLEEYGFALVFNKTKLDDAGSAANATLQNNVYYYSKDLNKRANFKVSSNGQFSIQASKSNLYLIDRTNSKYLVKTMDYSGREISDKKFDLAAIGLNQDLVSEIHFSDLGQMLFEVYDAHQELHLYQINLADPKAESPVEIDIPLPGSNPLQNMKQLGHWYFVGEKMGFYILARKGTNANSDPSSVAYHIAFYDEEFSLFRELLLDNFLSPGIQMLGKDASLSLNPALQSFVVSCLIKRNGKYGFLVANYGMSSGSSLMKMFWHKEYDINSNDKYKIVEPDATSFPPVISNNGKKIVVNVCKGKPDASDESLNQMAIFDAQGNNTFNAVQMGNYQLLNLDGFCVDNDNLYSRIQKLQMAATLKPYCEKTSCDVMGIDVDEHGNEIAILRDQVKEQLTIFKFTAK